MVGADLLSVFSPQISASHGDAQGIPFGVRYRCVRGWMYLQCKNHPHQLQMAWSDMLSSPACQTTLCTLHRVFRCPRWHAKLSTMHNRSFLASKPVALSFPIIASIWRTETCAQCVLSWRTGCVMFVQHFRLLLLFKSSKTDAEGFTT